MAALDDSRRWTALTFLVLAQFMIVLDVSILNVALPSIQKDFSLSVSDLQWIVTAYTLAFGGFLLLGGRTADLFGRKLVFITGVICFTFASFLIGLTDSSATIVPLRALQGLAAGFMSPAALSLVLTLFHVPHERSRALSIWGAVSAGGATAGLLLGGLLTTYLNWRWNFFVNIPVGILVAFVAYRLLPAHSEEEEKKSLDWLGAVLVTSGLMLLVYTLTQGHGWGWTSQKSLGFIAIALGLLLAFVLNESQTEHPLMPLSFFGVGNVGAADLIQLPITASLFAMFFFLSLYVQNILRYSPIKTGIAFLPATLTVGLSAILAPRLIARLGYKPVLVVAPLLLAAGLATFWQVPFQGEYVSDILPGILLMAVGLGFSFVSITIAATSDVPPHESGLASGLLNTAQQIGGSLGLAILSSVAASRTADVLASSSHTPLAIAEAAVEGFHSAFFIGLFFAISASVLALLLLRKIRATAQSPMIPQ